MPKSTNKYLISALLIGLVFHGTSIFFTLESTYDALIHLFFADHYTESWFEPWNFKWYTGFTVMSYPPLVHQMIALFSLIGGLKFGLFFVGILSVILFITGVYRFSLLLTSNRKVAGYAAILAVFSSSFAETLHLFGQLPSIVGVSILMHALPEIYLWLRSGKLKYLVTSLSLIAVTVCSHHVTPIFGMVFFIFPLIGMAIMDESSEKADAIQKVNFRIFLDSFKKLFKRIIGFGFSSLILIIICILPYWINTKNNPITQVPIPHGSRDNFIEIGSSGLVFFLIPWGILLIFLPYIFYRFYSKRYLFFGISITILFILGSGGTTPIPKLLLGENAFNILTLDRFTLWASLMALPLFGEFIFRMVEADLKILIVKKVGTVYYRLFGSFLAVLLLFMTISTMTLSYFRPSQPQPIKMLPIVNFLNQDQHDQWRYLTLGFGDQMAWLSAQTKAMTVDGNYHSARQLPELTTKAIERLENSKFKGIEGIGSLQQFLTVPEKYNLKYVFSNDKFYDPILYFCGWQRLCQLENGIMVWERLNIPPVSSILPKNDIATWQKVMWGVIPLLTILIAILVHIRTIWIRTMNDRIISIPVYLNHTNQYSKFSRPIWNITHIWSYILLVIVLVSIHKIYTDNDAHRTPENAILSYYDALDFKNFEKAYALIDKSKSLSISQYMLEISVSDGLLSSYAKLDAIQCEINKINDTIANALVQTTWITPLEKINKTFFKSLIKKGDKWFIKQEKIDADLPPDQLYSQNASIYVNHGRRRITTEQTHHEDLLKQPVIEILSATLIKKGTEYAIVGEIQNVDNIPADVTLKGWLYANDDTALANYNAKYHVKHKLMPKEVSSFKINFEGIAWSDVDEEIPTTFDPDEFTSIKFTKEPMKFNLHVAGNVSGKDLYKSLHISDVRFDDKGISGQLFNSGIQEVTVPQLIFTYYNSRKKVIWVDHKFVEEGIRQQRKRGFQYAFPLNETIEIISTDMLNCLVNGLPNVSISDKMVPNRIKNHVNNELQKINHQNFNYLKIELNSFVGNPN